MHCTRQLLERLSVGVGMSLSVVTTASLASSCASEAGAEAEHAPVDASLDVHQVVPVDAETVDAGPRELTPRSVVCTSARCALSLVRTSLRAEGYCALLEGGTVACWGENEDGWLGRGDDAGAADSAIPAPVVGLSDIVKLNGTCAVDKSGSIWCWGLGPYFREGATLSTERVPVRLPIPKATDVAVVPEAGCAVVDGGVLCWGLNKSGVVSASEPIGQSATELLSPRSVPLGSSSPIRALVLSGGVGGGAAFALHEDGIVESWGANPAIGRISPLFPDPNPRPIALATVSSLDAMASLSELNGEGHGCAAAGGVGYCWGVALLFHYGMVDRALPEPIETPEPIVQISMAIGQLPRDGNPELRQWLRWCAVGSSGSVYCWGYNANGQAGDGTKEFAPHPVKVDLPGPAADVKVTRESTCALLTSGDVYCWGSNARGQLGNGRLKLALQHPERVLLPQ